MPNPSPCRGYDRLACTRSARLTTCQYASGPKRAFCRKISAKRSRKVEALRRSGAARKIVTWAQSRRDGKNVALSPMSKHYKDVAHVERDQPSIYLFRRQCKLFPHPVEIFSKGGISLPSERNYANALKGGMWTIVPKHIEALVPPLKANHHIYTPETHYHDISVVFPLRKYAPPDVIIGLKYVKNGAGAHLVFFEVRMRGPAGPPHATVVDPNGKYTEQYRDVFNVFFRGITYELLQTHYINRGDTDVGPHDKTQSILKQLGLTAKRDGDLMWTGGYCQTIACFTMIDYICTNQWESRNIEHFVRSTQEWLMSPEENQTGFFSTTAVTVRAIFIARYIAYRLVALFGEWFPPKVDNVYNAFVEKGRAEAGEIINVRSRTSYENEVLTTTFVIDGTAFGVRDFRPKPMSQFASKYYKKVAKKLF